MTGLYPLAFRPILKEKVWGGRRLERYGKRLAPGSMVGESWEVADLAATSVEGGGGGEACSIVANGPLAGVRLRELVRDRRAELLGSASPAGDGGFPLLVKLLDARENLSVQVHPSPAYAGRHADAHLKTESWYIVEAEPGSKVYAGVREGVDPAAFARQIAAGMVASDLIALDARAGDIYHLPSGTCHALGAGVLVAEVQTPSDTTFRVFDWGRTDRALHIDRAMECIAFGRAGHIAPVRGTGGLCSVLVESGFYTLRERVLPRGDHGVTLGGGTPVVWVWLRGSGVVSCDSDGFTERAACASGTSVLVPASARQARVEASSSAVILEAEITPGGLAGRG